MGKYDQPTTTTLKGLQEKRRLTALWGYENALEAGYVDGLVGVTY